MAERKCLMTFYPTKCKDNCFNCKCGGAEATKDMYVSIHNVQRVCAITGGAADTEEGAYIAEVIRNNLEDMVVEAPPVNQWISCQDKMPEEYKTVLVYEKDYGVMIGELEKKFFDTQYFITRKSGMILRTTEVTHWQPLPEPPKGGDTE